MTDLHATLAAHRAALMSGDDVAAIRTALRITALARYRHAQPVTLPMPMEAPQ